VRLLPSEPCAACLLETLREKLTNTRLRRLLGSAALALALGGMAAVPLAEVRDVPHAEASSVVPLPSLKVPTRQVGYQLATDAGDVLPFGAAASGAAPSAGLANPVVGVARTPSGAGAWTATADGGVLTAGDALFFGSLGGQHLNQPVVGIAATSTGQGYWLVSADGGVFAFGDAGFFGSLNGVPLNAPISALAPTLDGGGYWLVSRDGGVFTFGDAPWFGSVTQPLLGAVSGIAPSPSGRGYWLAGADGGVFAFGDAGFYGRPAGSDIHAPVVGIASSRSGHGYWIATADGGVFTYGDAPFLGSSGGGSWGRVVGIAAGLGRPIKLEQQSIPARLRNRYGHDVSWPQCDGPLPAPGFGFAVIGITDGHPFSRNPCLGEQWRWSTSGTSAGAVYVNLASPVVGDPAAMHGPAGDCSPVDLPCQVYNHSANNISDSLGYARASGVNSPMWWLDVEILNRWSANPGLNALTVKAAMETLFKEGIRVGVYSTPLQWRMITGGARLGLPAWVAGAPTDAAAPGWCDDPAKDFAGGGVWMVQSLPVAFDVNYACEPILGDVTSNFQFG
jgi:hypothetical protein